MKLKRDDDQLQVPSLLHRSAKLNDSRKAVVISERLLALVECIEGQTPETVEHLRLAHEGLCRAFDQALEAEKAAAT